MKDRKHPTSDGYATLDQSDLASPNVRFFVTRPAPCPYLPDRKERKVFAHLRGASRASLHHQLSQAGFRRSQRIAYRPVCEGCSACTSVRIPVHEFLPRRSHKRVIARNRDLTAIQLPAKAQRLHYSLLMEYLGARHGDGGMADMRFRDYTAMVEDTPIDSKLIEYRFDDGALAAVSLVDEVPDGVSMVYSFFHPDLAYRSLGTFMILDQIAAMAAAHQSYVYLGYWVAGSKKMAYKAKFQPLEGFTPTGWQVMQLRGQTPVD